MHQDKGYVYILTNPAFKDNWVKIGMTARKPDVRASDLNNTAVPLPYEVYATLKTVKYKEAEKFIHRMIDRLTDLRIRPNREFFNISPEEAYGIFEDIAKLFDDSELYLEKQTINDEDDECIRREPTTFEKLKIQVGEKLTYSEDKSIVLTVADSQNKIEYNGKIWSATALARELSYDHHRHKPTYCYFEYNGKTLWDIRRELEENKKYI